MAKVNYVRENMAFIEHASNERLSGNERLIWYALLHLFNARAVGADWPDDFISISNKRLLSLLPFSEDSLVTARNRLIQRGLIAYRPGVKNTKPPAYRMNYLSTGYPQVPSCYPQDSGSLGGNITGNMEGNTTGNIEGKAHDYYVNQNGNQNETKYHTQNHNDQAWRTSARVRGAVAQRLLDAYRGEQDGDGDEHADICYYMQKGMPPEQIAQVLEDCSKASYMPYHLHTAAVFLGLETEADAPYGY